MKVPIVGGDALSTYLTDHHAGATFGVELARRTRDENRETGYAEFFSRLAGEIEQDRDELEAIMRSLGVGSDRLKDSVAWAGEKLGRLKPNGRVLGYAPLSRVVELEGLIAGVSAKLALWRGLEEVAEQEPRLDAELLGHLAERAQRQLRELRTQQRRAVRAALISGG
jgi:predicted DNA-binding ribbon-helix-helix protein